MPPDRPGTFVRLVSFLSVDKFIRRQTIFDILNGSLGQAIVFILPDILMGYRFLGILALYLLLEE
jgi:hypothetical protein